MCGSANRKMQPTDGRRWLPGSIAVGENHGEAPRGDKAWDGVRREDLAVAGGAVGG